MLIALYVLFTKVCELPVTIMAWLQVGLMVLMPSIIVIAGIMLICSSLGATISQNMGATILQGIFNAIGYIVRTAVNAIGWLIRRILRIIPRIYEGSRNMFQQMGVSKGMSTLFAILVTTIVVI